MWLVPACSFFATPAQGQFVQQGPKLVGIGAAVALSADGNLAIVGDPSDSGNVGAARVLARSGGVWTQQGPKMVGGGAVGQAYQGSSVALSGDGATAIIGGVGDNGAAGAAWVFTRNGATWTQQGTKLAGSGGVKMAYQGTSVALSGDGNTAMIGGIGLGNDGYPAAAAWVFTRNGGAWTQQGPKLVGIDAAGPYIAIVGGSVALSDDGNTAILGGMNDNTFFGAAWVFTRNGNTWTQQGSKLVGTGAVQNTSRYVEQGASVALSGDGNTAIIGGVCDNGNVGAVWVFARSGAIWKQQGPKLVGNGRIGKTLQGQSVSIARDGNTAIVGGPQDSGGVGGAWLFTRIAAGVWGQQGSKLVSSDALAGQAYGASVAVSGDGNTAIIGGPGDTGNGAAWVLTRSPGAATITSVISAVVNAASFQSGNAWVNGVNLQPGIASNTWMTIQGTNLSSKTDTWTNAISGGNLPTSLDGVSVQLSGYGGQPIAAYLSYISPSQINLLCPNLPAPYVSTGAWEEAWTVSVSGPGVNSNAFEVLGYGVSGAELLQPAFFLLPGGYVVATRQDFSWAAKNGTLPGTPTTPAKPGDVLILWGTGFGPTNPPAPMGVPIPSGTTYGTSNPATVTVAGQAAVVYGAALTPDAAGLYQVAIQVPLYLPDGDYPVIATVYNNSQSPPALLTIRK